MTALPDPGQVAPFRADFDGSTYVNTPQVREQFWGYEISPNESVIDLGVLTRLALLGLGAATGVAAIGVWLVPSAMFGASPLLLKAGLSLVFALYCLFQLVTGFVGSRVNLQVDTKRGELREVVRTISGRTIILSRYGFDAVSDISVVSHDKRSQMVLSVQGAGLVPAGDGHALSLMGLKDRLTADLGLVTGTAVIPEFAGPLTH